ncbi:twin-arginine translocation signal domain-containing protein [Verrucomicrobium spinosum]|uniref:twin-arginine translocation signal domain-containing protein n=2 Tax=Verrucomicrobium spinosum TaxID=2736 RepID=UPI0001744FFA|nr:twin-arginine translocation signal domain-containing protein [Verrucomicrobium spinosum]
MHSSLPSPSRRQFLTHSALTAGACLLPAGHQAAALQPPYERTLRDRLWMWGHDAGSLTQGYGIGGKDSDIEPAAALEYMGIPNCCMVRFTGTPPPPFDDYVKQFAKTRRLTWSFVDGGKNFTTAQKLEQALDLAKKTPHLTGLDMDDFFLGDALPKNGATEAAAHLTVAQVAQIRKDLHALPRPLDLCMVIYTNQLHPVIQPHVDAVDQVYLWTWKARELANLEANFAAYRKIAPTKPTLLGIYMWDFGEKKTIPVSLMEHQCRLGLEWLKQGQIEGLIFHCTPLCGMKLEAVEWSRDWIARHANDVVRP